MLTLYGNLESGNVYKVRLLWGYLGIEHARVEVNQVSGGPRTPEFRRLNPIGKVPAVRLDDGRMLSESGAILFYFARGTGFWPEDPWLQTETLRWMFFEQYSHEPAIAVNRYIRRFMAADPAEARRLAENHARGMHALSVMNQHLARQDWFVEGGISIADIALYAYTHNCHEGGFDLTGFDAVRRWLARIEAMQGHFPQMQETSAATVVPLSLPG
ncbi:MAG: glutathione S-transferase family protein [Proteobacteria bacterium]|nr:glutathione S-transferase family protein [Pseudomonadota bacterium]MBI3496413.1 glutathione S-transferase family protein [Pseudomonadota bacterium]